VTGFSFARVGAMMLRYLFLLRSSWLRTLETAYWPAVQMLTWGFLQSYFASAGATQSASGRLAGTMIGAVLLWDILLRSQQGVAFSFLEELWSRNLANLMMSPLRVSEFIVALMAISMMRLAVGVLPVTFLAIGIFGFNIWSLGWAFGAFFVALALFAWAMGILVCGMLLRFGLGAENLAWSLMFAVQPLGCVYYPVTTLPEWLQPIALALPPTYVFEGLRALLLDHVFRPELMARALALDALYFVVALLAFSRLLTEARRVGSILQTGE